VGKGAHWAERPLVRPPVKKKKNKEKKKKKKKTFEYWWGPVFTRIIREKILFDGLRYCLFRQTSGGPFRKYPGDKGEGLANGEKCRFWLRDSAVEERKVRLVEGGRMVEGERRGGGSAVVGLGSAEHARQQSLMKKTAQSLTAKRETGRRIARAKLRNAPQEASKSQVKWPDPKGGR